MPGSSAEPDESCMWYVVATVKYTRDKTPGYCSCVDGATTCTAQKKWYTASATTTLGVNLNVNNNPRQGLISFVYPSQGSSYYTPDQTYPSCALSSTSTVTADSCPSTTKAPLPDWDGTIWYQTATTVPTEIFVGEEVRLYCRVFNEKVIYDMNPIYRVRKAKGIVAMSDDSTIFPTSASEWSIINRNYALVLADTTLPSTYGTSHTNLNEYVNALLTFPFGEVVSSSKWAYKTTGTKKLACQQLWGDSDRTNNVEDSFVVADGFTDPATITVVARPTVSISYSVSEAWQGDSVSRTTTVTPNGATGTINVKVWTASTSCTPAANTAVTDTYASTTTYSSCGAGSAVALTSNVENAVTTTLPLGTTYAQASIDYSTAITSSDAGYTAARVARSDVASVKVYAVPPLTVEFSGSTSPYNALTATHIYATCPAAVKACGSYTITWADHTLTNTVVALTGAGAGCPVADPADAKSATISCSTTSVGSVCRGCVDVDAKWLAPSDGDCEITATFTAETSSGQSAPSGSDTLTVSPKPSATTSFKQGTAAATTVWSETTDAKVCASYTRTWEAPTSPRFLVAGCGIVAGGKYLVASVTGCATVGSSCEACASLSTADVTTTSACDITADFSAALGTDCPLTAVQATLSVKPLPDTSDEFRSGGTATVLGAAIYSGCPAAVDVCGKYSLNWENHPLASTTLKLSGSGAGCIATNPSAAVAVNVPCTSGDCSGCLDIATSFGADWLNGVCSITATFAAQTDNGITVPSSTTQLQVYPKPTVTSAFKQGTAAASTVWSGTTNAKVCATFTRTWTAITYFKFKLAGCAVTPAAGKDVSASLVGACDSIGDSCTLCADVAAADITSLTDCSLTADFSGELSPSTCTVTAAQVSLAVKPLPTTTTTFKDPSDGTALADSVFVGCPASPKVCGEYTLNWAGHALEDATIALSGVGAGCPASVTKDVTLSCTGTVCSGCLPLTGSLAAWVDDTCAITAKLNANTDTGLPVAETQDTLNVYSKPTVAANFYTGTNTDANSGIWSTTSNAKVCVAYTKTSSDSQISNPTLTASGCGVSAGDASLTISKDECVGNACEVCGTIPASHVTATSASCSYTVDFAGDLPTSACPAPTASKSVTVYPIPTLTETIQKTDGTDMGAEIYAGCPSTGKVAVSYVQTWVGQTLTSTTVDLTSTSAACPADSLGNAVTLTCDTSTPKICSGSYSAIGDWLVGGCTFTATFKASTSTGIAAWAATDSLTVYAKPAPTVSFKQGSSDATAMWSGTTTAQVCASYTKTWNTISSPTFTLSGCGVSGTHDLTTMNANSGCTGDSCIVCADVSASDITSSSDCTLTAAFAGALPTSTCPVSAATSGTLQVKAIVPTTTITKGSSTTSMSGSSQYECTANLKVCGSYPTFTSAPALESPTFTLALTNCGDTNGITTTNTPTLDCTTDPSKCSACWSLPSEITATTRAGCSVSATLSVKPPTQGTAVVSSPASTLTISDITLTAKFTKGSTDVTAVYEGTDGVSSCTTYTPVAGINTDGSLAAETTTFKAGTCMSANVGPTAATDKSAGSFCNAVPTTWAPKATLSSLSGTGSSCTIQAQGTAAPDSQTGIAAYPCLSSADATLTVYKKPSLAVEYRKGSTVDSDADKGDTGYQVCVSYVKTWKDLCSPKVSLAGVAAATNGACSASLPITNQAVSTANSWSAWSCDANSKCESCKSIDSLLGAAKCTITTTFSASVDLLGGDGSSNTAALDNASADFVVYPLPTITVNTPVSVPNQPIYEGDAATICAQYTITSTSASSRLSTSNTVFTFTPTATCSAWVSTTTLSNGLTETCTGTAVGDVCKICGTVPPSILTDGGCTINVSVQSQTVGGQTVGPATGSFDVLNVCFTSKTPLTVTPSPVENKNGAGYPTNNFVEYDIANGGGFSVTVTLTDPGTLDKHVGTLTAYAVDASKDYPASGATPVATASGTLNGGTATRSLTVTITTPGIYWVKLSVKEQTPAGVDVAGCSQEWKWWLVGLYDSGEKWHSTSFVVPSLTDSALLLDNRTMPYHTNVRDFGSPYVGGTAACKQIKLLKPSSDDGDVTIDCTDDSTSRGPIKNYFHFKTLTPTYRIYKLADANSATGRATYRIIGYSQGTLANTGSNGNGGGATLGFYMHAIDGGDKRKDRFYARVAPIGSGPAAFENIYFGGSTDGGSSGVTTTPYTSKLVTYNGAIAFSDSYTGVQYLADLLDMDTKVMIMTGKGTGNTLSQDAAAVFVGNNARQGGADGKAALPI